MPVPQITELLFDHIWGQWCSDSQAIMSALPQALQQPMQAQPVLLHFERWLILLKVGAGWTHMLGSCDVRLIISTSVPQASCEQMVLCDVSRSEYVVMML
jgi:hypothetical protein